MAGGGRGVIVVTTVVIDMATGLDTGPAIVQVNVKLHRIMFIEASKINSGCRSRQVVPATEQKAVLLAIEPIMYLRTRMVMSIARQSRDGNSAPAKAGLLNRASQIRARNRHKRVPAAVVWTRNQLISSLQLSSTLQVREILDHWKKAPRRGNVVPSEAVAPDHPEVEEVAHVAVVDVVNSSNFKDIHFATPDLAWQFLAVLDGDYASDVSTPCPHKSAPIITSKLKRGQAKY